MFGLCQFGSWCNLFPVDGWHLLIQPNFANFNSKYKGYYGAYPPGRKSILTQSEVYIVFAEQVLAPHSGHMSTLKTDI